MCGKLGERWRGDKTRSLTANLRLAFVSELRPRPLVQTLANGILIRKSLIGRIHDGINLKQGQVPRPAHTHTHTHTLAPAHPTQQHTHPP